MAKVTSRWLPCACGPDASLNGLRPLPSLGARLTTRTHQRPPDTCTAGVPPGLPLPTAPVAAYFPPDLLPGHPSLLQLPAPHLCLGPVAPLSAWEVLQAPS